MVKIHIILGSTRPGRVGDQVAKWVEEVASKRQDAQFELVDIADYKLPLLDEPQPPSLHQYTQEHTKRWAEKIRKADGFIFVAPEYNHGPSAALKNAIDFVYQEWNNKAAGFVSYGSNGGSRAVEQLRQVMAEIQIADVRAQVLLYLWRDFENYKLFVPTEKHEQDLNVMINQLVAWSKSLIMVREATNK